MLRTAVIGISVAVSLTACSGEGGLVEQVFGEDQGLVLDLQKNHSSNIVVRLTSLRVLDGHTVVGAEVVNAGDRESSLSNLADNTYLMASDGTRLPLIAPPSNDDMDIAAGQRENVEFVFEGAIARGETATLIINDGDEDTSRVDRSPGFRFEIPLRDAAFIGGDDPGPSVLANIGQAPRSSLRTGRAEASAGSSASSVSSSISRVEALESELGATQTERGTVISLPGDVLFDYDEATIRSDARSTLNTLAELIEARNPPLISIEGHTDNRGSDAYNDDLAQRRAESVRDYLTRRASGNVRMNVRSFGEDRPVAPNETESGEDNPEGRQRNRRVEVVLQNG